MEVEGASSSGTAPMLTARSSSSGVKATGVKAALMVRPLLAERGDAGSRPVLRRATATELHRLSGGGSSSEPPSPEAQGSSGEAEEPSRAVLLEDGKGTVRSYPFDHVPRDASDLFNHCVRPQLLPNVLRGYNGTVLAYGQTGSGKTYTMGSGEAGSGESGPHAGLIQLTVAELHAKLPPGARVRASFIQIYCEEVHDLLAEPGAELLSVRMDAQQRFVASGAHMVDCASADEAVAALRQGVKNRKTGATRLNAESSRSHALFTLHLSLPSGDASGDTLTPKLHFVDLAGSERCKRAETRGTRLREGIKINVSLACLNKVLDALAAKKAHVPYRESALTTLLSDSLGGNSQTLMVACASPIEADYAETLNTLWYATRARGITNKLHVERVVSVSRNPSDSGSAQSGANNGQNPPPLKRSRTELAAEAAEAAELVRQAHEEAEQERTQHAIERATYELAIRELESQLQAQRAEGEAHAARELVLRGALLAVEQRHLEGESRVAGLETSLAELEAMLLSASRERDEAQAGLLEALGEAESAMQAFATSRDECAKVRTQLQQVTSRQAAAAISRLSRSDATANAFDGVDGSPPEGGDECAGGPGAAEEDGAGGGAPVDVTDEGSYHRFARSPDASEGPSPLVTRSPAVANRPRAGGIGKRRREADLKAELKSLMTDGGAEAAFKATGRIEHNSIYQNKTGKTPAPGEGLQRWPYAPR